PGSEYIASVGRSRKRTIAASLIAYTRRPYSAPAPTDGTLTLNLPSSLVASVKTLLQIPNGPDLRQTSTVARRIGAGLPVPSANVNVAVNRSAPARAGAAGPPNPAG